MSRTLMLTPHDALSIACEVSTSDPALAADLAIAVVRATFGLDAYAPIFDAAAALLDALASTGTTPTPAAAPRAARRADVN